MTDLATWLLDRIAEDEAVARAADPGPWKGDTSVKGDCVVFDRDGEWMTNVAGRQIPRGLVAFDQDVPNTAHIARHDPARVLAECAAKRAIVEEYGRTVTRVPKPDGPPLPDLKYTPDGVYVYRPGLREWERLTPEENQAMVEACTDPAPPPMTLRLLALPYADHDGYDPSWGVQ